MNERYFGWLGDGAYDSMVKIVNRSEAYVFNREKNAFLRNDDFMKAMFDPGSEFEEISKEYAMQLIEEWSE